MKQAEGGRWAWHGPTSESMGVTLGTWEWFPCPLLLPWLPYMCSGWAKEAEMPPPLPNAAMSHHCLRFSPISVYPFCNQINE